MWAGYFNVVAVDEPWHACLSVKGDPAGRTAAGSELGPTAESGRRVPEGLDRSLERRNYTAC
jgi:hypothetical protein